MSNPKNSNLLLKILAIGGLIAVLVYLFHPGVGQFNLFINGQPVVDPLLNFAAIPALLAVLLFTAILMLLAFLGVGMFVFMIGLVFAMFGIFIVAPYFWPMLVIILLVVSVMAVSNKT